MTLPTSTDKSPSSSTVTSPPALPSYLMETNPLELADLPLQVALLTMEVASLVQQVTTLNTILNRVGILLLDGATHER